MNHVLFDLLDTCMLVYLDDALIYSRIHEEHIHHVQEMFSHLQDHQLYLKPSKCTFLAPCIEFLGHTLSAAGVGVDANKSKVLDEWPQRTCMHDVKVFLGLCNYYCCFIQWYADIARPLTDLTQKHVPFVR